MRETIELYKKELEFFLSTLQLTMMPATPVPRTKHNIKESFFMINLF